MNADRGADIPAIRRAQSKDLPDIVALLDVGGLPSADLCAAHLATFFVATLDDAIIGVAGIEAAGRAGLLRSLAVERAHQCGGVGQGLVAACEALAQETGVPTLYLLTTTAADYFLRRGYVEVPRTSVPTEIAAHPQFRGLCPSSARCLRKNLSAAQADEPNIHQVEGDPVKTLEIYDPAMCCSTGVCGVEVDPVLVRFAADLKWVAEQGVEVKRYNLGQEPQAFAQNPAVLKEMEAGMERLPVIAVGGKIVATGIYLSRAQLAQKLAIELAVEDKPRVKAGGGCCNPKSGCC